MRHVIYLRYITLSTAMIFGLMGCAASIDPILLESSLNDTQRAISEARRLGADEYATDTFNKANRLLEGAQQAQEKVMEF